jgi:hypothetical protein
MLAYITAASRRTSVPSSIDAGRAFISRVNPPLSRPTNRITHRHSPPRGIHVGVITTRAQLGAAFAVLMAFGWWVTAQPPFSAAGTVGILVAGGALIALARHWRRHAAPSALGEADPPAGLWVWAVILLVVLVWELISFLGHPREAHPTISSITDSLQAEHVLRWLFFGGWLAIGWSLAA